MKSLMLIAITFLLVFAAACSSSRESDASRRGKRVITDCTTFQ